MIEVDSNLTDPVDLDFLRNITDNDIEFERDLLKIFIESSGNDLQKMEESLQDDTNNDWYLSSHSFKGSAASIGAFSLAKTLERAQFNKDANNDQKNQIIDEIKIKLDVVVNFLSQEFHRIPS
jgi:HPt (histidine-containing phosphotransfer) domain-containing protein